MSWTVCSATTTRPGALSRWSSLPIFDGGRTRANVQVAESNQRIAVSQYEKAVQTAFKEVADVAGRPCAVGERLSAQTSMVANTQKAFDLSNARFKAGVDNYLERAGCAAQLVHRAADLDWPASFESRSTA